MASQPRTYPPLYKSKGDEKEDRLAFFHILERLKTQKRTGWVIDKIPNPESISDHMYRMAVMAMCTSDDSLDTSKCISMAIVHDLAEAQVGDISPAEGIPKAEKRRLEREAMENFVQEMLHNSEPAKKIMALWEEYEAGESKEARFVKDLDRFELACQTVEYEREHNRELQPFIDSAMPGIRHPEIQEWRAELIAEREQLFASRNEPN